MKKSQNTIWDLFKNQSKKNIDCPACGLSLPKGQLNAHLDTECPSSRSTQVNNRPPDNTSVHCLQKESNNHENAKQIEIEEPVFSRDISSNGNNKCSSFKHDERDRLGNKKTTKVNTSLSKKRKCSTLVSKPITMDSILIDRVGNVSSKGDNHGDFNSMLNDNGLSHELEDNLSFSGTTLNENTNADNHSKALTPHSSHSVDDLQEIINCAFSDEDNKSLLNEDKNSLSRQELVDTLPSPSGTFNENADNSNGGSQYSPYYIANFKHIINSVLADEDNKRLFNDDDLNYIKMFQSVSDASQKLYVRLFQRKYKWLRPYKIKYPEIASDPSSFLEELVKNDLLHSGADNIDLETSLELLSLAETKSLSKHFNFNASGKKKSDIAELIIKHGKQHKSFFSNDSSYVSKAVLKKVRQIMGPCYKLAIDPKRLFTRILMLFSLPTISEDDEEAAGGQQQQLLTLLQVNKGELIFPEYKISKRTVIFQGRDDLIRYEEARQLENDILNAIESKKFEEAKQFYIAANEEFQELCNSHLSERDTTLPSFLRRYTASHVYIRCLSQGVEILQKLRQYKEAVEQLKKLLEQSVYCQDYRGRWWDRLALNLEQHLKQPEMAADAIKSALRDKCVRVGLRLSLIIRAERICTKTEDEDLKRDLSEISSIVEAPKITIRGRLFPRAIPGRKHVFISSSSNNEFTEDDITVLGVEQLAIEHYKMEGYPEGIHGEGSTFISLYALLFWDIIYDGDIPDAFISPYQTHPVDLNSESFFLRREAQILKQLEYIRSVTSEDLINVVGATWASHNGHASLVSWDRFDGVEHVQGLVCCLGSTILAGICERLATDFRFTRSGVPDLVVWNPSTGKVKIVEVKGPGDKLSSKQILWLDYLIQIGADAEVCLVEAVGSKKLRKC